MKREKESYAVTLAGSAVNAALLVFKFVAGTLGHSGAMIADAVHSLSDFVTDIIVLIFVRISSKPQDEGHDYGHGKYETLATAVIGIMLFAAAVGIIVKGAQNIAFWISGGQLEAPGKLALWAALASIILKEAMYRITARVGRRANSEAVIANAWHHRSDALSSVGTAVGIGGAIILGDRWTVLDPLASVIVGAIIIKVSIELIRQSVGDLTESSLPSETENEIIRIASTYPDVLDPHKLKTRRIGNSIAIEMHIRMDGSTSLYDAHERTMEIERGLKARFGEGTHVSIHIEPTKTDGVYKKSSVNESQKITW